jgi:hypothetical protein
MKMAFKDDPNLVWNQMRAISGYAEIAEHAIRGMKVALPDEEFLPKGMTEETLNRLGDCVYEMQKNLVQFNELFNASYRDLDPG